eukprot:2869034-Amphidinium_carterae.1
MSSHCNDCTLCVSRHTSTVVLDCGHMELLVAGGMEQASLVKFYVHGVYEEPMEGTPARLATVTVEIPKRQGMRFQSSKVLATKIPTRLSALRLVCLISCVASFGLCGVLRTEREAETATLQQMTVESPAYS